MVRVVLTDGMVNIGGGFQEALSCVKVLPGRQYDPARKVWVVGLSLREFATRCWLPFDIENGIDTVRLSTGRHITRYGNSYSREEWDAVEEFHQAEGRIREEFAPRFATLRQEAIERLSAAGLSDQAIAFLMRSGAIFEVEFHEEIGQISFSSEERRAAVLSVAAWYGCEYEKLARAEQDAISGM